MNTQTTAWTDSELETALRGAPEARDAAFRYLFADGMRMRQVQQYVEAHGGTAAEGKDVFQDAVVLFDRNVRQGKFNGKSTLSTYFFAIAKWHWVSVRRRQKTGVELDARKHDEIVEPVDAQLIDDDHRRLLGEALNGVGPDCKKLLLLTGLSLANEDIAREAGFSSADMARKAVFRCRERFRALIRQHPALAEVLKSIMQK